MKALLGKDLGSGIENLIAPGGNDEFLNGILRIWHTKWLLSVLLRSDEYVWVIIQMNLYSFIMITDSDTSVKLTFSFLTYPRAPDRLPHFPNQRLTHPGLLRWHVG